MTTPESCVSMASAELPTISVCSLVCTPVKCFNTGKEDKTFSLYFTQCIFDFEIRNKQMFTEARAFSRVTYFLFSGEPAGFFLKLT